MNSEIVFPASPRKAILVLLGSIGFVAIGAWLIEQNPLIGWACVVFFSLGIPASIGMMLPGKICLKLNAQGFVMHSPANSKRINWSDVERFHLGAIDGAKLIAIVYTSAYADQLALRQLASSVGGMEGAIPNIYTASQDEILRTLNEWHSRYAQRGA
jgi:hypothetical protein